MQKGGVKGLAKRFGAISKVFYCWIPLKVFLFGQNIQGGGVWGMPKFLEHLLVGFLTTIDFLKVFE